MALLKEYTTTMFLTTPLIKSKVKRLKVGDVVEITGTIYTGRDAVHKYLFEGNNSPVDLEGQIIYHCGPVMTKEKNKWQCKAAGPTTSIREEPYEADIIRKHKIRAIIGKGGMGHKTTKACQKYGCVYLHAIGGAAQVLAQTIKNVPNVYLEKFGIPEAMWEFKVAKFPAIVTIDAKGNNLHEKIEKKSIKNLKKILH